MKTFLKPRRSDYLLVFLNENEVLTKKELNRQWDTKKDTIHSSINYAREISLLEKLTGEDRTTLSCILIEVLSISNGIAKVKLHGNKVPWAPASHKWVKNIDDLKDSIIVYMDHNELLLETIETDGKESSDPVMVNIANIAKTLNFDNLIFFNNITGELVWNNHDDSDVEEHIVQRIFNRIPEINLVTISYESIPSDKNFLEVEYQDSL